MSRRYSGDGKRIDTNVFKVLTKWLALHPQLVILSEQLHGFGSVLLVGVQANRSIAAGSAASF